MDIEPSFLIHAVSHVSLFSLPLGKVTWFYSGRTNAGKRRFRFSPVWLFKGFQKLNVSVYYDLHSATPLPPTPHLHPQQEIFENMLVFMHPAQRTAEAWNNSLEKKKSEKNSRARLGSAKWFGGRYTEHDARPAPDAPPADGLKLCGKRQLFVDNKSSRSSSHRNVSGCVVIIPWQNTSRLRLGRVLVGVFAARQRWRWKHLWGRGSWGGCGSGGVTRQTECFSKLF